MNSSAPDSASSTLEPASVYLLCIQEDNYTRNPGVFLHNDNKKGRLAFSRNPDGFNNLILINEPNKIYGKILHPEWYLPLSDLSDKNSYVVVEAYKVASLRNGGRFPDQRFTEYSNTLAYCPSGWVVEVLHDIDKKWKLDWNRSPPPKVIEDSAKGLSPFLDEKVNRKPAAQPTVAGPQLLHYAPAPEAERVLRYVPSTI
jgi:hypothetical protein